MRESISYTFLLNIVILFIVVCAAIIAGIFSYNRAFRASTIISAAIEKYEGYNCLSKEEIARKLQTISYNTPFQVSCNSNDGKCEAATDLGYKVIANNLDFDAPNNGTSTINSGKNLIYGENMNSAYYCTGEVDSAGISTGNQKCVTNKHYQFGIYTYMYVDMPVISKLLKLPLYTKTSTLYDFRNYHVLKRKNSNIIVDTSSVFDELYIKKYETHGGITGTFVKDSYLGKEVVTYVDPETGEETKSKNKNSMDILAESIQEYYTLLSSNKTANAEYIFMNITNDAGKNYRTRILSERIMKDRLISNHYTGYFMNGGVDGNHENGRRECGFKIDYSIKK